MSKESAPKLPISPRNLLDPYQLFGIPRGTVPADLKARYVALTKKWHPDLSGSDTEEDAKAVNAAYETLSTPEKRQEYDQGSIDMFGRRIQRKPQPPMQPKNKAEHTPSVEEQFTNLFLILQQQYSSVSNNISRLRSEYITDSAWCAALCKQFTDSADTYAELETVLGDLPEGVAKKGFKLMKEVIEKDSKALVSTLSLIFYGKPAVKGLEFYEHLTTPIRPESKISKDFSNELRFDFLLYFESQLDKLQSKKDLTEITNMIVQRKTTDKGSFYEKLSEVVARRQKRMWW